MQPSAAATRQGISVCQAQLARSGQLPTWQVAQASTAQGTPAEAQAHRLLVSGRSCRSGSLALGAGTAALPPPAPLTCLQGVQACPKFALSALERAWVADLAIRAATAALCTRGGGGWGGGDAHQCSIPPDTRSRARVAGASGTPLQSTLLPAPGGTRCEAMRLRTHQRRQLPFGISTNPSSHSRQPPQGPHISQPLPLGKFSLRGAAGGAGGRGQGSCARHTRRRTARHGRRRPQRPCLLQRPPRRAQGGTTGRGAWRAPECADTAGRLEDGEVCGDVVVLRGFCLRQEVVAGLAGGGRGAAPGGRARGATVRGGGWERGRRWHQLPWATAAGRARQEQQQDRGHAPLGNAQQMRRFLLTHCRGGRRT